MLFSVLDTLTALTASTDLILCQYLEIFLISGLMNNKLNSYGKRSAPIPVIPINYAWPSIKS